MSRVGQKPLLIPDGVKVSVAADKVAVQGPHGSLSQAVLPGLKVALEESQKRIRVERTSNDEQSRCNHGTLRALIANMLTGVTKGFEKQLRISGVGYGAKLQGSTLVLTVGFSHAVELPIPPSIKVSVPAPEVVIVQGSDRQQVGQFAALIRRTRPVEPYNLKGIKYEDEVIKKKAGKTFVSGA